MLNKIDLLDKESVQKIVKQFKGLEILPVSCGTLEGIAEFKKRLAALV